MASAAAPRPVSAETPLRYYAGLRNVPVLENLCQYAALSVKKEPQRAVLVGPGGRKPPPALLQTLKKNAGRPLKTIGEAYPGRFDYAQLARHPAVVLVPYATAASRLRRRRSPRFDRAVLSTADTFARRYQVSVMSLFEYYRMNLPIFAPTPELLLRWHRRFDLLKERTWNGVRGPGFQLKRRGAFKMISGTRRRNFGGDPSRPSGR